MSASDPRFLHSFLIDGKGKGRKLDVDEVVQWSPEQGLLWLHMDVNDRAASHWLRQDSGLPEVAVDGLLAGETRPRSIVDARGFRQRLGALRRQIAQEQNSRMYVLSIVVMIVSGVALSVFFRWKRWL